ncbi:hypothetical protein KW805_02165 [Candidatus Pacearchaeota archaeon]|nr:hypothetical protein [Candidatus Pacearchaeota archaeon]
MGDGYEVIEFEGRGIERIASLIQTYNGRRVRVTSDKGVVEGILSSKHTDHYIVHQDDGQNVRFSNYTEKIERYMRPEKKLLEDLSGSSPEPESEVSPIMRMVG